MKLPRSYGSRVYLALVAIVAAGLLTAFVGAWRPGVVTVGAAFILGAAARAVISVDHAGMLHVRGRLFDVVWMGFLGVSLITLALTIPAQPI